MLEILNMIHKPDDLRRFDMGLVLEHINRERLLPQEVFIDWLKLVDAYWFFDYQDDPRRPHALLHAGDHSDGFVDSLKLLKYPKALAVIAAQLITKLKNAEAFRGSDVFGCVDWVIGSPMAGITLAYEVARQLNAINGFTEKADSGKGKIQKRLIIEPSELVLMVEELTTTMATAREQRAALEADGKAINYIPVLGVFFNRSGENTFGDWPVISVVEQRITNWTPDSCPLCKKGSAAIPPKKNWSILTSKYSISGTWTCPSCETSRPATEDHCKYCNTARQMA